MKNKILSCIAAAMILSGCVSQDFQDNTKKSREVKQQIDNKVSSLNYTKAISIDNPPFDPSELDDSSDPMWLKSRIDYEVAGLPLSVVLQQVINNRDNEKPIEIIYGAEVNPNALVSISVPDGTIKEAFNLLTSETNYGFVYKENSVDVERHISASFSIPLPPGVYSSQMGNQGRKADENEGAIVEGQFINIVIKDENIVDKVLNNIKGILSKTTKNDDGQSETFIDGSVTSIDGLSLVTVSASPSNMRKVESYIAEVKKALSKQILLDFRVLEFRSNNGNERGADLNLVRDVGEGSLQFFTQGTNLFSSSQGYGFSFKGTGKWDNTTAFIKALEKQGTVSVERPLTQLALNNIPVRVTQNKQNPYLEDLSVSVDEGVITTDFTRGTVPEGVDFASVANIQDDYATIRVAGKMQSVIGSEKRKVGDTEIQFYTTREADINFTGKMKYGRTYIISRVSQTKLESEKAKNFGTDYIGSNATQKEHVETLILLTPKRFEQ